MNEKIEKTEDEEIKEKFSEVLAYKEENEEEEEYIDTHHAEIISPIIAALMAGLSIMNVLFYTAYIGVFVGVVGMMSCKKKAGNISKGILWLNVIMTAFAFFMGGLWLIIIVLGKM